MSQTWKPHVSRTSKLYYYYYYYWDVPVTHKATDNIVFYNYNYISCIRDGWTNFKFCTLFSFVLRRSVTVPNVMLLYVRTYTRSHTKSHYTIIIIVIIGKYRRNRLICRQQRRRCTSVYRSVRDTQSFVFISLTITFSHRVRDSVFFIYFYVSSHYF